MPRYDQAVDYVRTICPKLDDQTLSDVIYVADFHYYRHNLKTITGDIYTAGEHGPVRVVPERVNTVFKPLTYEERTMLRGICVRILAVHDRVFEMTVHERWPWKVVRSSPNPNGVIPYGLFRWNDNVADDNDVAEARRRIEEIPGLKAEVERLSRG